MRLVLMCNVAKNPVVSFTEHTVSLDTQINTFKLRALRQVTFDSSPEFADQCIDRRRSSIISFSVVCGASWQHCRLKHV